MSSTSVTLTQILEAIAKIVADKKNISLEEIKEDSTLKSLQVDSLDLFDIMFNIEHTFDIEFPDDIREMTTLKDVALYTQELIAEAHE